MLDREASWVYGLMHILLFYIWKIIEGLAPNFSNPITSTFSGRRGRSCIISHVNVGRVGTLAYNSLPMHLRSVMFVVRLWL